MVGKRQGHQPTARDPAFHAAEDETVLQVRAQRGRRVNNRLVPICPVQGIEPWDRMENRCAGMFLDERSPSRVLERINRMDRYRDILSREACLGCTNSGAVPQNRGILGWKR